MPKGDRALAIVVLARLAITDFITVAESLTLTQSQPTLQAGCHKEQNDSHDNRSYHLDEEIYLHAEAEGKGVDTCQGREQIHDNMRLDGSSAKCLED